MSIPLLAPIIIGGITTLVGNFFVNRQQQITAEREFRAAELKMANLTVAIIDKIQKQEVGALTTSNI